MVLPIVLLEKLPANFQNHAIPKKKVTSNDSNDSDQKFNQKNSKYLSISRLRNKRKRLKRRLKTCENGPAQPVSRNLLAINHNILSLNGIGKKLLLKKNLQKKGEKYLKSCTIKFVNNKFTEEYLNHLYTPIVVLERLPITNRLNTNVRKGNRNLQENKERNLQENKGWIEKTKLKEVVEQERLQKSQAEKEKLKKAAEQERLRKLQEEEEARRIEQEKIKKYAELERFQKMQAEKEKKQYKAEKSKKTAEKERLRKLHEAREKKQIEKETLKKAAEKNRLQKLKEEEMRQIKENKFQEEMEVQKIEEEKLKKTSEQERLRKLKEKEEARGIEQEKLQLLKLKEEEEQGRLEAEKLQKAAEQKRLQKIKEEEEMRRLEEAKLQKAAEQKRLKKIKEEEEMRRLEEEKLQRIVEEKRLQKIKEEEETRRLEEEKLKRIAEQKRLQKIKEKEETRQLEAENLQKDAEEKRLQKIKEEEEIRRLEAEKLQKAAEEKRLQKIKEEEEMRRLEEEKLQKAAEQKRLQKIKEEEEMCRLEEEKLKIIAEQKRLLKIKEEEETRRIEQERVLKMKEEEVRRLVAEKLQREEQEQLRKLHEQEEIQRVEQERILKLKEEEEKRRLKAEKLQKEAEQDQLRKVLEEEETRRIEKERILKSKKEEEIRRLEAEKLQTEAEQKRLRKLLEEEDTRRVERERIQTLKDQEEMQRIQGQKIKNVAKQKRLQKLKQEEEISQIREGKSRNDIGKLQIELMRENLRTEQQRVAMEKEMIRMEQEEKVKKIIEKEKLKIMAEKEVIRKVVEEERSKNLVEKEKARKVLEEAILKKISRNEKDKVAMQIRQILTDSDRIDTLEGDALEQAEETLNTTTNSKGNTEHAQNNLLDEVFNVIKTEPVDEYEAAPRPSNVIVGNGEVNHQQNVVEKENGYFNYVNSTVPIKTESTDNHDEENRSGSITLQEACEQITNDSISDTYGNSFENSGVRVSGLNSLLSIPNDSDDAASDPEMNEQPLPNFVDVNGCLPGLNMNVSSALAEMFNCIKCGQFFRSERSLRDHTRCCMVPPYLECVFCFWKTNRKNTLRKHIKVKHKQECTPLQLEPLLIEIFRKSAPLRAIAERAALIDNTLLNNSENLTLRCDECFETFTTKTRLQKHIFKRHWRMPIESELPEEEPVNEAEVDYEDMEQKLIPEIITTEDPLEDPMAVGGTEESEYRDKEVPALSSSPRSALVESTYGFVLPRETQNFVSQSVTTWCPTCDKCTSAMEKYIKCYVCDTPYIYGCKWCKQQKRNYQLLRIHVIRHHTERIHTCGYCGHSFSYIQDYRHHLKFCVKEKNIRCPNTNCFFRTKYQRSLRYHLVSCREGKNVRSLPQQSSYSRSLPDLVPMSRSNRQDRNNAKPEFPRNSIPPRRKQFNSRVLTENPIPRKRREEPEPVPKLKLYFKKNCLENWTKDSASSRYKPAKKANIARRYHCYKCGKNYKNNKKLSRHMSSCGKKNMFVSCDHCSFKTVSKATLVAHIHSKHAARLFRGIEAFNCSNCRQVFRNYFIYERHTDKCKKVRFS